MLHKYLLVPAVLAVAGLLIGANAVQAQHRGGTAHVSTAHVAHSGNVGHVTAYHGGAYHGGAYYGGAYYGGHPYYRGYAGAYWPGYYAWNWYNPYAYAYTYPYATYNYPIYNYSPNYYVAPTPSYVSPPMATASAMVEVIVPDPSALVWFDGTLTRQTGTDRIFQTAVLNSTGIYHIRAAWNVGGQQVSQERTVAVTPNQTAVVDFTRPPGG
jgi:uncharacterized protein (TIGR03000 family)